MTSSKRAVQILAGNFGRLWKRGHESFPSDSRRIISVKGKNATAYLQGLVTCDLTQLPTPPREEEQPNVGNVTGKRNEDSPGATIDVNVDGVEFSDHLRATCFLDNKGRILTDSLLWKVDETQYYIDVPANSAEILLGHLNQFILRRTKVKVKDETERSGMASHVVFGTLNSANTPNGFLAAVDPRHPSLGMRVLSLDSQKGQEFTQMMNRQFPDCSGTYNLIRKLAGVPEGAEIKGKVAAETNQEFLNAVSFQKGCYLGQELTARVQFTGAVRKRIMPLMITNVNMQVPRPWLIASQIQKQQFQQQQQQQQESVVDPKDATNDTSVEDIVNGSEMSPLPRLSPSIAASMIATLSGSTAIEEGVEEDTNTEFNSNNDELQAQMEALFDELQTSYKVGDKIFDTRDGKTIGQIVALPEEGTNVLLAQVRLDKVGLMKPPSSKKKREESESVNNDGWNYNNKISIGESNASNPLRFFPYLPLWWPSLNPENGKAKEEQ